MGEPTATRQADRGGAAPRPFSLLERLYGDPAMAAILDERATVAGWLRVEVALARAQAAAGVIAPDAALAVEAAARPEAIDFERLWEGARTVGYPILPLVQAIVAALPAGAADRVHHGATTQDIMDTGLALQLGAALGRLEQLACELGDALCTLVEAHRDTVMAARTHAQQAVPTTLGAKLAVHVDQLLRQRQRCAQLRPRVCLVSLHGAGGTSAAYGAKAAEVRAHVAGELGLGDVEVPWHVARDGLAELGALCASLCAVCARLGREVIDLARSEIGELTEGEGHHRGASSTMPQKANPVLSEAIVGMAGVAGPLSSALYRAMEAGHERAAGEWQVEWQALPQLLALAAGALATAGELMRGVQVDRAAIARNLELTDGGILAEAYMMRLSAHLGRQAAHDAVYAAVRAARAHGTTLAEALHASLPAELAHAATAVGPEDHLGRAGAACDAALAAWRGAAP